MPSALSFTLLAAAAAEAAAPDDDSYFFDTYYSSDEDGTALAFGAAPDDDSYFFETYYSSDEDGTAGALAFAGSADDDESYYYDSDSPDAAMAFDAVESAPCRPRAGADPFYSDDCYMWASAFMCTDDASAGTGSCGAHCCWDGVGSTTLTESFWASYTIIVVVVLLIALCVEGCIAFGIIRTHNSIKRSGQQPQLGLVSILLAAGGCFFGCWAGLVALCFPVDRGAQLVLVQQPVVLGTKAPTQDVEWPKGHPDRAAGPRAAAGGPRHEGA